MKPSVKRRLERRVRWLTWLWKQSGWRLALYFGLFQLIFWVIVGVIAALAQHSTMRSHSTQPHALLILFASFAGILVFGSLAYGFLMKLLIRRVVQRKLTKYGLTYEQFIRLSLYTYRGYLPEERVAVTDYRDFISYRIRSLQRSSIILTGILLLDAYIHYMNYQRDHLQSEVVLAIVFAVIGLSYPIQVYFLILPRLRRALHSIQTAK